MSTCSGKGDWSCILTEGHNGAHDLGETVVICPFHNVPFHFMTPDQSDKWWMACPIDGKNSEGELLRFKNSMR